MHQVDERFSALEREWESTLPRHSFTVLRVDGKGFSKFTKHMRKEQPFSMEFTERMKRATLALATGFSGTTLAFTQSDEISLLLHDFGEKNMKPYGGRVEKMASLGAATATAHFNLGTMDTALFDGRVFSLGDDEELVREYFASRYFNGVSNSVGMLSSFHYSHSSLMGMGTREKKERLEADGHPWSGVAPEHRYGVFYSKVKRLDTVEYTRQDTGETMSTEAERSVWEPRVLTSFDEFNEFTLR